MSNRDAFLRYLAEQVGRHESPAGSNRQPYAAIAGHANGYPWCATLIVAAAIKAAVKGIPNTAYTPTMAAGFKAAGRVVAAKDAQPGDILLMDFLGVLPRIEHVGAIVDTADNGRTLRTIEGNTSVAGSQSNG